MISLESIKFVLSRYGEIYYESVLGDDFKVSARQNKIELKCNSVRNCSQFVYLEVSKSVKKDRVTISRYDSIDDVNKLDLWFEKNLKRIKRLGGGDYGHE